MPQIDFIDFGCQSKLHSHPCNSKEIYSGLQPTYRDQAIPIKAIAGGVGVGHDYLANVSIQKESSQPCGRLFDTC